MKNILRFLPLVLAAWFILSCDQRQPTAPDKPPLLELYSTDSVITFPFPSTVDALGNIVTPDFLEIQARALNADRGLIMDSVNVHFFTTSGSISGLAQTLGGVAKASYFPQESNQAYYDSIWAFMAFNDNADTVWASKRIKVMPATAGPSPIVNQIELSASPTWMQVNSSGGSEQATVSAEVRDKFSNLIADGTPVYFRILSGPGGGERLGNDTGFTKSGIAQTSLISGSKTGVVDIQASNGAVKIHKSLVTITSGPPARISITPIQSPLPLDQGGTQWTLYVQAKLTDINLNEVRDGWAVMFSVDTAFSYDRIISYPAPETTHFATDLEGLSINPEASYTGKRYAKDALGVLYGPLPGVAETYIKYPSTGIFDSIRFIASTIVDSMTTITASKVIGFPLPCDGISLSIITANNVLVPTQYAQDTCVIIGKVQFGASKPIQGAKILLTSQAGTLIPTSRCDSNGVSISDANGEVEFRVAFFDAWRASTDRGQTVDMVLSSLDQPCIKTVTRTVNVTYAWDRQ